MAGPIFLDRVAQVTTASGVLTTFTLGDVVLGYKPFSQAGVLDVGDTFYCIVRHVNPVLNEWQVFEGTLASSTTITVGAIGSSSEDDNSAVTFSAGNKYAILDASAEFLMNIAAGSGTVTSVGLASDSDIYTVTGSPITGAGAFGFNKTTGLTANRVYATPSGAAGVIGLRALDALDIPDLSATYSTLASTSTAISSALTPYSTTTQINTALANYLLISTAASTYSTPASVAVQIATPTITDYSNAQHPHTGASSGGQLNASNVFSAGVVPLARGGTNVDLSAGGGTGFVLKQATGGVISSAALVAADLPNHSATLITSGTLPIARGGTNADLSATGGTTSFLRQASTGAAVTVGGIASADLTTALTTPPSYGATTPSTVKATTLETTGNVGFGVAPGGTARAEMRSTGEALRLSYDAANYVAMTVTPAGNLSIAPIGTVIQPAAAITTTLSYSIQGHNMEARNSFYFPNHNLLMQSTAASGDSGNAYTFSDAGGSTARQIKVSSVRVAATASGTLLASIDTAGGGRFTSLRIDQAPVAATPTPTHTVTINLNGTNYRIPCVI